MCYLVRGRGDNNASPTGLIEGLNGKHRELYIIVIECITVVE